MLRIVLGLLVSVQLSAQATIDRHAELTKWVAERTASVDTLHVDLDGDGQQERILHFQLVEPDYKTLVLMAPDSIIEDRVLGQVLILKRQVDNWKPWEKADGPALYATEEAGLSRMSVEVDGQVLVIGHYSGGYTHLSYVHRFRWQHDRFELIGATFRQSERCTGGEVFDYNLSTRQYTYEEWHDYCEETEAHDLPPKPAFQYDGKVAARQLILLTDFVPGSGEAKVSGPGGHF